MSEPSRVRPYLDGPPTTPTSIPTDLMSRTGQLRTVEREADDVRARLAGATVELHAREGEVRDLTAALAEERAAHDDTRNVLKLSHQRAEHLEHLLAVERARTSSEDLWPRTPPPERPQRPPQRAPRVFDPPRATREDLGDGSVYAQTQAAMRARFIPLP